VAAPLNPPVEYVTLRTRLSPEECFHRLQPLTLPWISTLFIIPWAFSKLPVMGWVWPTGFALRKITIDPLQQLNGLQPEAKAQFVLAPEGGTQMRVRLGVRTWITVFGWVAIVYVVLFGEVLNLLCRWTGNQRCKEPSAFLWPLVLPVLFVIFQMWPWRQVRIEKTFLVNFLKQTLQAEEVPEHMDRPQA
jgi:hypothetical protein